MRRPGWAAWGPAPWVKATAPLAPWPTSKQPCWMSRHRSQRTPRAAGQGPPQSVARNQTNTQHLQRIGQSPGRVLSPLCAAQPRPPSLHHTRWDGSLPAPEPLPQAGQGPALPRACLHAPTSVHDAPNDPRAQAPVEAADALLGKHLAGGADLHGRTRTGHAHTTQTHTQCRSTRAKAEGWPLAGRGTVVRQARRGVVARRLADGQRCSCLCCAVLCAVLAE